MSGERVRAKQCVMVHTSIFFWREERAVEGVAVIFIYCCLRMFFHAERACLSVNPSPTPVQRTFHSSEGGWAASAAPGERVLRS